MGFPLGIIQLHTHKLVKLISELIAVVDVEHTFEEVDVLGDLEVLPGVVVVEVPDPLWDLLPFDEDALGDP